MSVSQILTTYDGAPTSLCIAGGGGGSGTVNSVSAGPGLTITGAPTTNPTVNLGFTNTNQLLYGTGLNTGTLLGPGAPGDFLRINNAITPALEWHPISAGGVVSVSANPGGACFVNNTNSSTPAIALAFPAGDKGAIPGSDGTGVNQGAFLPGPTALQQNYILAADNMSAVGFSWKAAAGVAITGEAPLVEFVDGVLTKVGIDFAVGAGGIGQIPVGISSVGGKEGVLTPALVFPADEGKVFTAIGANVATGGVGWTTPTPIPTGIYPVDVAGGNVYLQYTANKGDLFAGSGTVNTGALLPLGNQGEVLSVLPTAPSGLAWVPQSGGGGGGPKIVRGSGTATTIVDIPTTANDTLVLVAAEDAAIPTWQPVPTVFGGPDPYDIECETAPFLMPNGLTITIFFYNILVNGRKCVELYYRDQTAFSYPMGHFYNSYDSVAGVYDENTFVSCCIEGQAGILQTGSITNSFVCGGNFNFFHYEDQTYGPDVECHGLAEIAFPISQLGVPTIKNLDSAGVITPNFGLVLTAQVSQNTFVSKLEIYQGYLNVYGCFNAIATGAGNPFNSGLTYDGFASFASWEIADGTWELPTAMLAAGLGVYLNIANPAAVGVITDAVRVGGTKIIITGEFLLYETTAGGQVPATCEGFAVYDATQTPNPWVNSPVNTDIDSGYCVRPSISIANSYIVAVGEVVATFDVSRLYIYDDTANTLTITTGAAAALTQYQGIISFNTITGLTIDIGAGAATHDFILVQDFSQQPTIIKVLYMTGGGLGTTFLDPNPTGLIPQYYPPPIPSQALYAIPPYYSAFGITNIFGNTPTGLVIGVSQNYKAQWNPPSAASIVFTLGPAPKGFYWDNSLYNTATFAPAIGTALYSSQMLVASTDLNTWINVGAKATGLTYT